MARLDGAASRETISRALTALVNLEHRGAEGADADTGDGARMLPQIPDALFRAELALPPTGDYGVAVCFLPHEGDAFEQLLASTAQSISTIDGLIVPTSIPSIVFDSAFHL